MIPYSIPWHLPEQTDRQMVTYIKKWPVPHELLSRVAVAEAELEELVLSTLVAFFALFYLIVRELTGR